MYSTFVDAARAGRQRVGAEHPDPVELAAPAALDDPERRLHLGERHVGPGEAVERRLDPEPGAGAGAVGVDRGQVPVDQVVVR